MLPVQARAVVWREAILGFAASRIAIALVGLIGCATLVDLHSMTVGGASALNPVVVWHKFDSIWYERIALHGYAWRLDDLQGRAMAAFFPVYPLTIGLILKVLPGASFFWTASIVSALCSVTAIAVVAHRLITGLEQRRRLVAILLTAAGSFYLSIPYTEGLYLLLVTAAIVFTRNRQFLAAALVCGVATVTRPHGLALSAIPIVASLIDERSPIGQRASRTVVCALLCLVPLALYMVYLDRTLGSPLAFLSTQALWDNSAPYPLKAFIGLLREPRNLSAWVQGLMWTLYAGLLVRYWRTLRPGEALFCAVALLISTQQTYFQGIYRYTLPLIPIAIQLADDRDAIRNSVTGFNLVVGTIMLLAFVTNNRFAI